MEVWASKPTCTGDNRTRVPEFLNTGFAICPVQNLWESGLDCVASGGFQPRGKCCVVWGGRRGLASGSADPADGLQLSCMCVRRAWGWGSPQPGWERPHGERLLPGAWEDAGP